MKRAELFHPRVFSDREWARGYHERNAGHIERVGRRFAAILGRAGFEEGRILDAGCGFGAVAIEVARRFPRAEVVGVDLGRPLLELGRSLAEDAGVADRIDLREGDVQALDLQTGSFAVVISTFMMHVVEDPVSMLNEMERVAGQQAIVMMTDLRRTWLGLVVRKLRAAYTLAEARAVVERSSIRPGRYAKGPFWWDFMAGV